MAIVHVQGAHNGANPNGTTIAATGAAVWVGKFIVGIFFHDVGGATLTSITENKGNNYTISDVVSDSPNGHGAQSFFLGNITNGPSVLTATFSGTTNFITIVWNEYSGVAALADPRDGHGGQVNSSVA